MATATLTTSLDGKEVSRTLTNDQVTKDNLIEMLDDLIIKAKAGNLSRFHYQGPGKQIVDRG